LLINTIQTLYSVPTVCVGLLVYLMVSHAGPFGYLDLVFTPTAMIIAQVLLIVPVMLGLTITALSSVDKPIKDTTLSLGATEFQAIWAIVKEARFAIVGAVLLGFGRAISEVGAAMIVGGNIDRYTRVLTTAISLLSTQGEFAMAMALGIILIAVALVVNIAVNMVQQRR
jgi:tungstate transport system permease protein